MPESKEYSLEELIPEGTLTAAKRANILMILRGTQTSIRGGDGSNVEQSIEIRGQFESYPIMPVLLMAGFIGMLSGFFPSGTTTESLMPQFMNEENRRYERGCVVYTIQGSGGAVRDFYFKLPPAPPNRPQA